MRDKENGLDVVSESFGKGFGEFSFTSIFLEVDQKWQQMEEYIKVFADRGGLDHFTDKLIQVACAWMQ